MAAALALPGVAATEGEAPGAPLALTATPGPGGVLLEWQPPLDEGGSPITEYRVYRASEPDPAVLIGTTSTPSFVDGAQPETSDEPVATQFYVVTAVNEAGEGPASQPAAAATVAWGPCLSINPWSMPPSVAIDPDSCLADSESLCHGFSLTEPGKCWAETLYPDDLDPGLVGLDFQSLV